MEDADADELDAVAVRRVSLEGPLHVPPVAELEGDLGRAAVDVEHLDGEPPREGRLEGVHGGLRGLAVRVVDAVLRRQLGAQEVVVAADGHHLRPGQGAHPVGAGGVSLRADGLLVLGPRLVHQLHLPALEQPLHLLLQRALGPHVSPLLLEELVHRVVVGRAAVPPHGVPLALAVDEGPVLVFSHFGAGGRHCCC